MSCFVKERIGIGKEGRGKERIYPRISEKQKRKMIKVVVL